MVPISYHDRTVRHLHIVQTLRPHLEVAVLVLSRYNRSTTPSKEVVLT